MEKGNPVNVIAEIIHQNSSLSAFKALDVAQEVADGLHEDGWLLIHSWARSTMDGENFYTGKVWEG